jgi:hypothetical protein
MKRSLCSLSSVSVAMTGESVVILSGTLINISLCGDKGRALPALGIALAADSRVCCAVFGSSLL